MNCGGTQPTHNTRRNPTFSRCQEKAARRAPLPLGVSFPATLIAGVIKGCLLAPLTLQLSSRLPLLGLGLTGTLPSALRRHMACEGPDSAPTWLSCKQVTSHSAP